MQTFKKPLTPKQTDFSFKSFMDDLKFVREHAQENPFGIKPDPPEVPKPVPKPWVCDDKKCPRWSDGEGGVYGTCAGSCGVG